MGDLLVVWSFVFLVWGFEEEEEGGSIQRFHSLTFSEFLTLQNIDAILCGHHPVWGIDFETRITFQTLKLFKLFKFDKKTSKN